MEPKTIDIKRAREHNLRNVSLSLPRNALICFTGVSGSGKSSLAFDTLFAEGQRRYVESLSSYARQFLGQFPKPDCDHIAGLSPSIAIQQKTGGWNPRSTVATVTGIHDFLRVLYARVGVQHCTRCGRKISAQSREEIIAGIRRLPAGARFLILAPVARRQKGEFRDRFDDLRRPDVAVAPQVVELRDDLALSRNQRHDIEVVIDRLTLDEHVGPRLAEAVEQALRLGEGTLLVLPHDGRAADALDRPSFRQGAKHPGAGPRRDIVFSSRFACAACGLSFDPPSPQLFSFNSPTGMCLSCDGLGDRMDFDESLLIPDPSLSFYAPCIVPWRKPPGKWRRHIYDGVARHLGVDLNRPWKDLSQDARRAILHGTGDARIEFDWRGAGGLWRHHERFDGVLAELQDKYRRAGGAFVRQYYEQFMRRGSCPNCRGTRLNDQARAVRLDFAGPAAPDRRTRRGPGLTLPELCARPIDEVLRLLTNVKLTPVQTIIAADVLKEIRARLEFLLNVGLHYLTLDRPAPSLSGGESQRIRLAGQIGGGLTGVLYVLDEPSIGLHPRDNRRLLDSLLALRNMGNTVIVVEHDEETMRTADYVVDFGPGPGVRGGEVVAAGTLDDVVRAPGSVTGAYLSGKRRIAVPLRRRPVLLPTNVDRRQARPKSRPAK